MPKFVQDNKEAILFLIGVAWLLLFCGLILFADSPTGKRYINRVLDEDPE